MSYNELDYSGGGRGGDDSPHNNAPVIGAAKLAGAVTEQVSPGNALTDTGTIAFTDVDSADVHSVSATALGATLGTLTAVKSADTTGTGTGGVITWSYSVDDAKVTYLTAGQTKVESFTVTVDDGQGGTVSRQVDVTIAGIGGQPASFASGNGGSASQGLGNGVVISGTSGIVNDQSAATGGASTITVGTGGTITASGTDATDPYNGQGIFNGNQGTGETRIGLGVGTSVTGSANGIVLVQSNTGNASAVSITTGGDVTGLGGSASRVPAPYGTQLQNTLGSDNRAGYGVLAVNAGTGTLDITTTGGAIQSSQDNNGIMARNAGGLITVNNGDAIRHAANVTGGTGIDARNTGTGGVSLTNSGTVSATGGAFVNGLIAVSSNAQGAVSVGNQGILGGGAALTGTGITAIGAGAVTVSNAAAITASTGISANGSAAGAVTVNHTAGTIQASGYGIDARSTGSGAIVVNQTGGQIGTMASPAGLGLNAERSASGTISVTAGTVFSGNEGVRVINFARGDITVAAQGNITAGGLAINASIFNNSNGDGTGNVAVTTAGGTTLSSGNVGEDAVIKATHAASGTGYVQVTNAATLTRPDNVSRGNAIFATNGTSGLLNGVQTAVSVTNTGAITNNFATGINATASGTGAVTVSNAAAIAAGTGIGASSYGAVTVNHTAGLIQATSNGIAATSFGAGGVTVNQSGGEIRTTATGGGVAAINVEQHNAAGALTVTAGAFTSSAEGVRAINFVGGDVTVTTTQNATGAFNGVNAQILGGSGNVTVTTAANTTLTIRDAGIGASHYAGGTGYAQVINNAAITQASGVGGNGISASNGTSGPLNGVQTAVSVTNTGAITNVATGIIASATGAGVVAVFNFAAITASGTAIAVSGSGGGSVVNSGTVNGATGLSIGGGSFTLSNTGSIAGTTAALQIASGTLTVNALGKITGAIVDAGQLTLNQAGSYTFANAVSGSGALTVQNVGAGNTATLSGALTQRGGFTVADASAVTIAATGSYTAGPAIQTNGGVFTNLGAVNTTGVAGNGAANDGIYANAGGSIINGATGTTGASVRAASSGIEAGGGNTTVTNYGLVTGRDFGGVGRNAGTGTLTVNNLNGTAQNTGGAIYAQGANSHGWGVYTVANTGLSVTNESAGRIVGKDVGVYASGVNTSITNAGTVASGTYTNADATGAFTPGGTAGIQLNAGGSITNSGLVTGTIGLSVGGTTTTLANTGTLTGTGGTAIQIAAGTLTINALGTITGAIADAGQLTLNQAGSYTFANAVSGAGALTVRNVGAGNTATLSGALTQRGGFTVADASAVTTTGSFYGVKLNGGTFTNLGSADTRAVTNAPSNNTDAIQTNGGGTVTNGAANATGATIQGGGSGLGALGSGATTVNNYGLVVGRDYAGVGQIGGNGAITINNLNGTTTGTGGVIYAQGARDSGWGAFNNAGGGLTVANASAAKIIGSIYGVYGTGAASTVTNAGTIASGSYDAASGAITVGGTAGIRLNAGGSVTNAGTVQGTTGLSVGGGTTTLSNTGTITGTGGNAIRIDAGTLIIKDIGTINGAVADNGQLVLNRAGSYTFANAVSGAGSLVVQGVGSGNTATLSGALTQRGGFTVADASSVTLTGSYVAAADGIGLNGGTFTNQGIVRATGSAGTNAVTASTTVGATVVNAAVAQIVGQGSGVIQLFGNVPGALNVTNSGLIQGINYDGVTQHGTGALTVGNTATGVIHGQNATGSGNGYGVGSDGGGLLTLTNATGGQIVGQYGAVGSNAGDTITNAGTIASGSYDATSGTITPGGIAGVQLRAGGTVSNTGTISGNSAGVQAGGTATVTNSGAISAVTGRGVDLSAGGTVTNKVGGTISHTDGSGDTGLAGVYSSGNLTLTNAGTISTAATGASDGVTVLGVATVTNSGTIQAAAASGLALKGAGSSVVNSGTIQGGTISTGVTLISTGTIDNQAGGTIAGSFGGIRAGDTATIINAGTIQATSQQQGIYLANGGTLTNGGTANTGALVAAAFGSGVIAYGDAATSIDNYGRIQGTTFSGAGHESSGTGAFTLNNLGTGSVVYGTGNLGVFALGSGALTVRNEGLVVAGGSVAIIANGAATVTNSGTVGTGSIDANGAFVAQTTGNAMTLNAGGTVVNQAGGGIVGGGTGVIAYGDAATSIDNYGRIQGTTYSGAGHESSGTGAFTLNNLGTGSVVYGTGNLGVFALGSGALTVRNEGLIVTGGSAAIIANGAATVTNSGTVGTGSIDANGAFVAQTTGNAMTLYAGGTVVNQAGGSIVGGGDAIYAGGALALTNAGSIGSQGDAVFASAGGSVLNTGSVTSAVFSAIVGANGLAVTNAAGGTLTGGANGDYGYAVQFARNDGTFDNYGTATGSVGGVLANQNIGGGAGVTLGLHAGSTTGAIRLTTGDDTVSIDTGTGTAFAGLTGSGTVLQKAGTNAAAIVGAIDLGGGTNTLNLRGSGDGSDANGAVGTLDMSGVSGATTLNKVDGGTFVLTGAHTGTVAVDVQAGRLIERDTGAAFGSGSVAIRAGAVVELHNDVDVTHAPTVFNGAGFLEKTGTGTLTLSGASTYAGGTFLKAGTLELAGTTTGTFGAVTSAAAGTGSISFGDGAQTLRIAGTALGGDTVHTFGNAITGFATDGDVIDVWGIGATVSRFDYANSILNFIDGTGATKASLHLTGSYIGTVFTAASDGASGTQVTLTVGNEAPRLDGTQATLATGIEDIAFTVSTAQLLKGFVDPEGTNLSVTGLSVDHGTIASDGRGGYTVAPAADYNGPLTISYAVSDGTATISAHLSTTLAAVNDAPVITGGSFAGAVTELVTPVGSLSSSGSIAFADVDLTDTHTVSAVASGTTLGLLTATLTADTNSTGTSGSVAWSYAVDANKLESLAEGETKVETFTVVVTDDQGATASQDVRVTITGTNDAPVLAADTASHALTETAGTTNGSATLSSAASLAFADVDLTDTHTAGVSLKAATWSGGSVLPAGLSAALAAAATASVADSTGTGSGSVGVGFKLADKLTDFLAAGETLSASYSVSVTDKAGLVSTQPVTFTVTGTNDAPVLAADTASHALTETAGTTNGSATLSSAASLAFADVDLTDTHTAGVSLKAATWSGGSVLPAGLSAALAAAATASVADSTGTGSGSVGVGFSLADKLTDFLAAGETLSASYSVSVTDKAGLVSTQPVTFTVTGTNDAPVLAADTASHALTETAGTTNGSATLSSAASLAFADVDLTDTHTAGVSLKAATWSGGSVLPAGLSAALVAAATASVADSTGTGSGSVGVGFSLADKLTDFLAAGETLSASYSVSVTDKAGLVSTQPVTFTVTGTNDAPVLAADTASHALTETAGTTNGSATLSSAASLAFADVDLTDTHTAGVSLKAATWSGGSVLPAGLSAALVAAATASVADSTGTGSGSVGVGFSLADKLTDFLAAGETLSASYSVSVTDKAGLVSTQPVTFTVTGTNDAPVLAADTASHALTETAGTTNGSATLSSAASLAFADVDLTDTHTAGVSLKAATWSGGSVLPAGLSAALAAAATASVADSTGTGSGSVGVGFKLADKLTDFLAAGETLSASYSVSVTDKAGLVSTQPVTFTVTGTNDAPVLAADTASHALTETAGTTNGSATLSSAASLAFADVDLTDTHTAGVSLKAATWSGGSVLPAGLSAALAAAATASVADSTGTGSGSVGVGFSLADKLTDFLAAGETLSASYSVSVTDKAGLVSTQPVTFTVTGTNDAPVLAADTASHALTETAGTTNGSATLSSAASLAFADVDLTDTHTAGVSLKAATWSGGSVLPAGLSAALAAAATASVADSTGTGSGSVGVGFKLADKLTDFLAAGETLSASYSVSVTDKAGLVSTQPVTFTVTGTNDAPVLDLAHSTVTGTITERAGVTGSTALDTASGSIAFADVDLNDRPTGTVTAQTLVYTDASGSVQALTTAQSAAIKAGFSLSGTTASNNGSVGWNYSLADNAFDFLGAGEHLALVSTVQVDDHHGGLVSQAVSLTVNGSNDAPGLMADIAGVQKFGSISIDAAHGVLANDRDVDLHDGLVVTAISNDCGTATVTAAHAATVQGTYGDLMIRADGSYSYASDLIGVLNQTLRPDLVPVDTFTYTVNDGHGGTTTNTLNVTTYTSNQVYVQGTDGNDTLTATADSSLVGRLLGLDNAMVLNAGNGNDTLIGGKANDVLIAGTGLDKMTGGAGSDTFVFTTNFGKAVVTDFKPLVDEIQFDHTTFANFTDVRNHAAQVGTDVVITADADHTVTLQNTLLKNLQAIDFHFA